MLDTEEFMLSVKTSISSIGQLRDELIARNIAVSVFGQLVDEAALDVSGRTGKDGLHACCLVVSLLHDLLSSRNGGDLSTMGEARFAVEVRRVEGWIRAGEWA